MDYREIVLEDIQELAKIYAKLSTPTRGMTNGPRKPLKNAFIKWRITADFSESFHMMKAESPE